MGVVAVLRALEARAQVPSPGEPSLGVVSPPLPAELPSSPAGSPAPSGSSPAPGAPTEVRVQGVSGSRQVRESPYAVTVVDEVHGFRFFDDRDLLGFVDGTENPAGAAAVAATAIGDEDPDFAGGSYVHVQKYLHDMSAWRALSVEEQERVIGRTKLEDIEMSDDVKPANAHIALNVIEDSSGEQLQIMRQNMPFGELGKGEFGTYFIGYSRDPGVTEQMLRNMFLGDPPGNTDRILDFSTALTGGLFFTPSGDWLDAPPDLPAADGAPSAEPTGTTIPAPADGSLGIGGLKER